MACRDAFITVLWILNFIHHVYGPWRGCKLTLTFLFHSVSYPNPLHNYSWFSENPKYYSSRIIFSWFRYRLTLLSSLQCSPPLSSPNPSLASFWVLCSRSTLWYTKTEQVRKLGEILKSKDWHLKRLMLTQSFSLMFKLIKQKSEGRKLVWKELI